MEGVDGSARQGLFVSKDTNLYQDITSHTKERGVRIGSDLRTVFDEIGFDPGPISKNGALCLDIGFGPEIEAMRQFNPRILVASEELDYNHPNLAGREEVISGLSEGMNFDLVRGYNLLGIDRVRELGIKVGIVAQLNTFPERLKSSKLNKLIDHSSQIISEDGIILISATTLDAQNAQKDIKKTVEQQKSKGRKVGYLEIEDTNRKSAGGVFIYVGN